MTKALHLEVPPTPMATPRKSDVDRGGRGDVLSQLQGHASRHAGMMPTPMKPNGGRALTREAIETGIRARESGLRLSGEQRAALGHVLRKPDLALVVGYAGAGKSAMLGVAREAWESAGYTVRGAALSGIAAENLEGSSGIASRTLASYEHAWSKGHDRLTSRDVLVIDEAGMIGTLQLQRILSEAAGAGAKVVMVGDIRQLQAIEAGAAYRLLAERHGAAQLGEVRRQSEEWMREATKAFATGRSGEALAAYMDAGMVHRAETREAARATLIERWDAERRADPAASRIILTHTNKEVRMLNEAAREKRSLHGELGENVPIRTERGVRQFADNDRVLFLRNERDLGVKNGTLATIEKAVPDTLAVRLDDGRRVTVDLKSYAHVDHGYAATVHKAQGMTVDRTHVLATPGLDAHSSYVALSRHRTGTALHYGRDDFSNDQKLRHTLARDRGKDMALDYDRPGSQRAATSHRTHDDGGTSAPREQPRRFATLLSRVLGRSGDERRAAPDTGREAGGDRGAASSAQGRNGAASRGADPANSEQAKALRAMMAARNNAPRRTPESMREALAAAKKAPSASREHDYGAER